MTTRIFTPPLFATNDVAPVGKVPGGTRYNPVASAEAFSEAWRAWLKQWTDICSFYSTTVSNNPDGLLGKAIPMLTSLGIPIRVHTAGLSGYRPGITLPGNTPAQNGIACANQDYTLFVAPIQNAGGVLRHMYFDSMTRRSIINGASAAPHAAFKTMDPAGTNNSLLYTAAISGLVGNSVRVRYAVAGIGTALTIGTATDAVVFAQDAFGRTVANGWGPADVGNSWTVFQTASDYAVNGGVATMRVPTAAGTRRADITFSGGSTADQVATVGFSLSAIPVGNNISVGVWLRFADASNQYRFHAVIHPDGTVSGQLLKDVAGVITTVVGETFVNGLVLTAGVKLLMSAAVKGTTLAIRVWPDGTDRPVTALASATVTSLADGAGMSLVAITNGSVTNVPITVSWYSVATTSYPTTGDITVNIQTNGTGAAISTAAQVLSKVNLDATAQLLVRVTNATGNDGSGIVGALGFSNLHDGDDGWNLTALQVAQGIGGYINQMQALVATIEGYTWHESQVLCPYNGKPGYSSQAYPANQQPDFKDTIDTVLTYLSGVGLLALLEAFHDDDVPENDNNLTPSSHQFADDWFARHFVIQTQLAGYGVKYGISFGALWGGTPGVTGAPVGYASDRQWQTDSLAFLGQLVTKHNTSYPAVPRFDIIEGMGFQFNPRTLAPDTVPYSFMDTYERWLVAYAAPAFARSSTAAPGAAFTTAARRAALTTTGAGAALATTARRGTAGTTSGGASVATA